MNASNTSIGAPTGDSNPMRNVEIANKISGENHWLYNNNVGRILLRNRANKLVENGTHNWLGDKNPNKDGAIARRQALRVGRSFLVVASLWAFALFVLF